MASPATIDLDQLLKPITDENPAGEDLRADVSPTSAYYQLKDARKLARSKERDVAADGGELPDTRGEWRPVRDQAIELLAERSKDIEVVAWLIEAQVRLNGFAGLRDCLLLTKGLVESYWDDFYPRDDVISDRIAPYAGLNGQDAEGTLIFPIRNVPITEEHSVGPFTTWHFEQAISLQQMSDPEARERRIAAGAVTMSMIDKASLESDAAFLRDLLEDLAACREAFEALTAEMDARCGSQEAPPSSNIKKELNNCQEAVQYVARRIIAEDEAKAQAAADAENAGGEDAAAGDASGGQGGVAAGGMTREQAFRQLLQLAEFFRRTEPHSPLSYAIERIVRWGQMPLPELLNEIITEEDARRNLFWLAGITQQESVEE